MYSFSRWTHLFAQSALSGSVSVLGRCWRWFTTNLVDSGHSIACPGSRPVSVVTRPLYVAGDHTSVLHVPHPWPSSKQETLLIQVIQSTTVFPVSLSSKFQWPDLSKVISKWLVIGAQSFQGGGICVVSQPIMGGGGPHWAEMYF